MSSRLSVLLAACGVFVPVGAPAVGGDEPQAAAPGVTVRQVVVREVSDHEEFTGRTEAAQRVDIRSRVTGYLDKVVFQPGTLVKKGDLLFEIDPRPYVADLTKADADLHVAEARLKYRAAELERAKKLKANQAVGVDDFSRVVSEQQEAEAAVAAARATREAAMLNVAFTRIAAPIDGRIGQPTVTAGNLVKADDTLLATIVNTDPLYVFFQVDERTLLRLHRLMQGGRIKAKSPSELAVSMGLSGERGFPHKGKIDFLDNQADSNTGTIRMRAIFPNADPMLLPGLFARVRLTTSDPYKALLVPEQAVGSEQGKKFVFVVTDRNVVEQRPVKLAMSQDGWQVVKEGLKDGEWVVVKGFEGLKPGVAVKPERLTSPAPGKP